MEWNPIPSFGILNGILMSLYQQLIFPVLSRTLIYLMRSSSIYRTFASRSYSQTVQGTSGAAKLFGGRSEASFIELCEKSSKYVSDVLSPKVSLIDNGVLTMILPYKKDFIGNPLIPCLHGGISCLCAYHLECNVTF